MSPFLPKRTESLDREASIPRRHPWICQFVAKRNPALRLSGINYLLLMLGIFFLMLPGCTRNHYRRQADREVMQVIKEKQDDPAWTLPQYDVYPNIFARFADPTRPDRPPMPPDDPGAERLSPRPQRPKQIAYVEGAGYLELLQKWNLQNRARGQNGGPEAGNIQPTTYSSEPLPVVPAILQFWDGFQVAEGDLPAPQPTPLSTAQLCSPFVEGQDPFLINLEQALELGFLNSREYQTQREDLYIAALPVTFQRFNFLFLPTLNNTTTRQIAGKKSSVGPQDNWTINTNAGVSKLFSTGARLLVQFANTTVISMTGMQVPTISQSTLVLDLVQPLLRGGGRAVTLEPLTQSERNLLYEVRDFARFHKIFKVGVTTGVNFIQLRDTFADLRSGTGVGYYPTLLRLYQLRNEEQNLKQAASSLTYFRELARGGAVSQLQVDSVEQAYLTAQANVLQRRRDFNSGLDLLKVQLGLPTNLPLMLDDSFLKPLTDQMRRYEKVEVEYNRTLNEVQNLVAKELSPKELRAILFQHLTKSSLVQGIPLQKAIVPLWEEWKKLVGPNLEKQLLALRKERLELEKRQEKLEIQQQPVPSEITLRLRQLILDLEVGNLELALRLYEVDPKRLELFRRVVDRFALLASEAREQQVAQLQNLWPDLPPLHLGNFNLLSLALKNEDDASNLAGKVALENRLDLMNQRAQLVDSWRRVAVTANALLGTFNVRYNAEFITPPGKDKPFDFADIRGRHQFILNTDLPFIRQQERNDYRLSLIVYQRQRRNLMLAEDQITFDIRENIRQLRQEAENYKIQQRALDRAYSQISNSQETFREPQAPGEARETGGYVAALTQQLLNAQTSIPQIQNALLNSWVNYVSVRELFYLNLEAELRRIESQGACTYEFVPPPLPDFPHLEIREPAGVAREGTLP